MILYHAISSYQLLEVTLHRLTRREKERAALLLPDFIREKYPWVFKLQAKGYFDRVELFPYLQIPHTGEEEIASQVREWVLRLFPGGLRGFSEIYAAGAHFYFSLYLIREGIPFCWFEDAAGLLSRPEDLYLPLRKSYPRQAKIGEKYGLFDGSCPLIKKVICLKRAQEKPWRGDAPLEDFSLGEALRGLSPRARRRLVRLFVPWKIWTRADTILLTQQLSRLGILSRRSQEEAYRRLWEERLRGRRLLVKPHPDDPLDYQRLLPGCRVLRRPFPSELLPYVFYRKPRRICTFDSSGCANLEEDFEIERIGRSFYESCAEPGDCKFRLSASDSGAHAKEPFHGSARGPGGDGRYPGP